MGLFKKHSDKQQGGTGGGDAKISLEKDNATRLQYLLTQALFYLHDSPWLQDIWALDSIRFAYDQRNCDLKRPYYPGNLSADPCLGRTQTEVRAYGRTLGYIWASSVSYCSSSKSNGRSTWARMSRMRSGLLLLLIGT